MARNKTAISKLWPQVNNWSRREKKKLRRWTEQEDCGWKLTEEHKNIAPGTKNHQSICVSFFFYQMGFHGNKGKHQILNGNNANQVIMTPAYYLYGVTGRLWNWHFDPWRIFSPACSLGLNCSCRKEGVVTCTMFPSLHPAVSMLKNIPQKKKNQKLTSFRFWFWWRWLSFSKSFF